jgi:hypothetical protein
MMVVEQILSPKYLPAGSRSRLPENLFGERVAKGRDFDNRIFLTSWFWLRRLKLLNLGINLAL